MIPEKSQSDLTWSQVSYRATKLSPHHVPYPFWFKLLWFKSLGFFCTSEGGAIADCTKSPLAPKCFFADLCQGSHLPTTYGILLLHRRCYRSLYGLEGDSDPPAASAGGWPGCPARQTHWEFVHGQRENWLSQAANRQKTIAPPQPPSTPPPVYSNIGKMETLESRSQYCKASVPAPCTAQDIPSGKILMRLREFTFPWDGRGRACLPQPYQAKLALDEVVCSALHQMQDFRKR